MQIVLVGTDVRDHVTFVWKPTGVPAANPHITPCDHVTISHGYFIVTITQFITELFVYIFICFMEMSY